jgi:hypothetical protein
MPKTPETRDQRFVIRLSLAEKKRIEHAAWVDHRDMSSWARLVLLREADRRGDEPKRK